MYTKEFKQSAIKLALSATSIKKAADSLGLPESTLNGWVQKMGTKKKRRDSIEGVSLAEEIKKLRKINARLQEERDILKKAATFFVKESQ